MLFSKHTTILSHQKLKQLYIHKKQTCKLETLKYTKCYANCIIKKRKILNEKTVTFAKGIVTLSRLKYRQRYYAGKYICILIR